MKKQGGCPNLAVCPNIPDSTLPRSHRTVNDLSLALSNPGSIFQIIRFFSIAPAQDNVLLAQTIVKQNQA